eukprot:gene7303-biopygen21033
MYGRRPACKGTLRTRRPRRGRRRRGGGGGRMGPEVGPTFQRRYRAPTFPKPWRPVGEDGVQARGSQRNACFVFGIFGRGTTYRIRVLAVSQFPHFGTGGSKRPGYAGLRAAIRTVARARKVEPGDTDGLWEYGWPLGVRMASGSTDGLWEYGWPLGVRMASGST